MTKTLVLLISVFLPFTLLCQDFNIIPNPVKVEKRKGFFELKSTTEIIHSEALYLNSKQLKQYLDAAAGLNIKIGKVDNQTNQISLRLNEEFEYLKDEGYVIDVSKNKIQIEAFNSKGIFWALQTLRQLLKSDTIDNAIIDYPNWYFPMCNIEDRPRFAWRGLMIDYSRTFWDLEVSKKYIDVLSYYKMNKLHMHLTDDQGWRIEIDKYPKLTEIASKFDTSYNEPKKNEGYYSKSDFRELIAYANERNIEIIPEIEMPGHSSAVFSVYPELSCKNDTLKIHPFTLGPSIHNEIYCAGNDETLIFIKDVLSEICDISPSKYIHIGGDEAPKKHWVECVKCQQRIKDEGLKDEHELQSWFIKQVEVFLTEKGKILIGWDEIADEGLSETATVMYWRTREDKIPGFVVNRGNNIIMTPKSHCYFDYTYETISTEKVYSFNPVSKIFEEKHVKNVLGVQANFWSHLNRVESEMDSQIFPRLLALSEVGWTSVANKNWSEFSERLNLHLVNIESFNINYYGKE